MNDEISDREQRERDRILLNLLKTPPEPRPKRERGEEKPTSKSVKRASVQKRERGTASE